MLHLFRETLHMEKFRLEISKPCHEDWESMSREVQGRFCSSCKKTVVDFTNMSDRQLAAFFRMTEGEVCGRLYNDQLERAINIPKKRVPWFRYFFQFTWPAFVFFLKSCGTRDNTKGVVVFENQVPVSSKDAEGSSVFLDSTPVISGKMKIEPRKRILTGVEANRVQKIEGLTVWNHDEKKESDSSFPFSESFMDTVRIESYNSIMMGGLSITRCHTVVTEKEEIEQVSKAIMKIKASKNLVYPNPVSRGGLITISCGEPEKVPEIIQILSSSGQLIFSLGQKPSQESSVFNIRIPENIAAGVYFIRMLNRKTNEQRTEKIVVR